MKTSVIAAALIAFAAPAMAQVSIVPVPLHGCGTMSVSTSSTSIATANITLCPNSPGFPTGRMDWPLRVKVQGSSSYPAIFCKMGGTCSTGGEYIAVGESITTNVGFLNITTQPPTIIGVGGTATVYLEW